ncbi:MAG: polymer-forming cytoskeletal protein [Thermacetogeniaceae bacterium]
MAWGKKVSLGSDERLATVLGKETGFEGTLVTTGGIRIDGQFKGVVKASGDVIIGENARVEAKLSGRNVLIAGEVYGQVDASGKLELTTTGKLFGDLRAPKMYVEEGAVFHGECKTITEAAPAAGLTEEAGRAPGSAPS